MNIPLTTVAGGADSGIATPRRSVVRDAASWRALWAAHAGPEATAPPVDFTAHTVAAVFAGELPDPGHSIAVTSAHAEDGVLTLIVDEPRAAGGLVAAQILVSPFHIVTLARFDGEVRFAAPAAGAAASPPARAGRPAPPAPDPDQASSSTGLEPNLAAALAYLAGPFSGALILLVERANRYVRFHAWQSLIGLGGLGVIAAATLVFSFLTLLVSPLLFTVMYRLSGVAALLWIAAWVWCLVMAFTGRPAKLPVAGRFAERLATAVNRTATRTS